MLKQLIKKIPGVMPVARKLGLAPPKNGDRSFLLDMFPKHSLGAEIGVHKGDFSNKILAKAQPRELHLIDPWEHMTDEIYQTAWYGGKVKSGQKEMDERYGEVCSRFKDEIEDGVVKIHRGYSDAELNKLPDDYLDWVYIDGNHLYDFVKKDLELSYRKTKVGGLITGDDYFEGGWWSGGVTKAVDEFPSLKPVELVEITNRQFIFRKIK